MQLTDNAKTVLEKRYFKRNENGELIENWQQMIDRIATDISGGDQKKRERYYRLLDSGYFLPNSPTLMNAGNDLQQLSACFVLPLEDSMDSIFETVKNAALIHKSGGGTGFSFSRLRQANARVRSTNGVSSGPISFLKVFNAATDAVKQGGCLIPETLVHTEKGTLYLSEICNIEKAGWQEHNLRIPNDRGIHVSQCSFNNGIAPTILVKTADGFTLQGTPEHKVKVYTEKGLQWKNLIDLKEGDQLFVKLDQHLGREIKLDDSIEITHPNQKKCNLPSQLNREFAYWLGLLHGDGFVAHNEDDYRIGVSVNKDSFLFGEFPELTRQLFDILPISYEKENDNSVTFVISNKQLKTFLKKNGLAKGGSATCSVPVKIREASQEIIGAFLSGLFEADGSLIHKYPYLSSSSQQMSKEVAVLLRGLGIPCKIETKQPSKDRLGFSQFHTVTVKSKIGLDKFIQKIGWQKGSRFSVLSSEKIDLSKEKTFPLPNFREIIEPVLAGITKPQHDQRHRGDNKNFASENPVLRKSLLRYLRHDRVFSASSYLYYTSKYEEFKKFAPSIDFTNYFDAVVNVQPAAESLTLDLSEDKYHTYLANGFVTHNTRRGANMAILNVDHPEIMEFITCKENTTELTNFNISVGITDKFMKAVNENEEFELIAPHTGEVAKKVNARDVFNLIVKMAHQNGEPGIVFIDRINKLNPTPNVGRIESTNPCGEQPLLPNEACNLGSLNLAGMIKAGKLDWKILQDVVYDSVEFLDDVINRSQFPLPAIEKMVKANRKIGLGVMGWADLLYLLRIPYDSEEALTLAEEVMEFIDFHSKLMSMQLAEKYGSFPNFSGSVYENGKLLREKHKLDWEDLIAKISRKGIRNATTTTIAPTGTISMILNTSGGIEPQFSLVYVKNVMDGAKLLYVNPIFEQAMRDAGIYSRELMEKVSETGSIAHIPEIPEEMKKIFVTSHDISPQWHIKMQAAFQKYTDNAVSKTINFNREANLEDIQMAYELAWELKCKGVTVYRDGSRENQVLNLGREIKETKTNGHRIAPRKRPAVTTGITQKVETGCGNMYVTINSDEKGACEIFTQMGKVGGCASAQLEAIARLTSLCLRSNVKVSSIIRQLQGIRCPSPMWSNGSMVTSCADSVAKSLERFLQLDQKALASIEELNKNTTESAVRNPQGTIAVCPDCGSSIEHSEGCLICNTCGWSKC